MKKLFTILVADRNPHVRDFLRRELTTEGFNIRMAKSAAEVLCYAFKQEPVDLLILDPDLPDLKEKGLYEKLEGRIPPLPFIVHGFLPADNGCAEPTHAAGFVEKMGNSIEPLKTLIYQLFPKANRRPGVDHDERRAGP